VRLSMATTSWYASERTILWRVSGERILRKFARMCALDVMHLWDAPDIVVQYLKMATSRLGLLLGMRLMRLGLRTGLRLGLRLGCGWVCGSGCGLGCGLGCGSGCGLGCGSGCGSGCGLGCCSDQTIQTPRENGEGSTTGG
jgi:hypothetical protein